MYVTIDKIRDEPAVSFKVEKMDCGGFDVTDLSNGKASHISLKDFDFIYNSLIRLNTGGDEMIL